MKITVSGIMLILLLTIILNIAPRVVAIQSYDILIIDDVNKRAFFGWYRASQMPPAGWDLLQRTIDWAVGSIAPSETEIVLFTYDGTLGQEDAYAVFTYLTSQGYTSISLLPQWEAAELPSSYYADFVLVLYWNTYGYDSSNIVSSGIPFITISTMQTDEMGIGTGSRAMHELRKTFYIANNSYYPTRTYSLGMLYFESEMWTDATEANENGTVLVSVPVAVQPPVTEPNVIKVPQNYSTIQAAINAADPGDRVLVANGTYCESVVLNKTLSLIGENRSITIVDGTIHVIAYNTAITGFTIRGGGVKVHTGNNIINNSVISNCGWGIELRTPGHNTICGNTITNNQYGIVLSHSLGNVIHDNLVTNSLQYGIGLWQFSNYNEIRSNLITDTQAWGIGLRDSHHNVIEGNTITNNSYGIDFLGSSNNEIYHNNLVNNSYQVDSPGSSNSWDDGYPSGGNYWSDYAGTDLCRGSHQNETGSDGIGDSPYVIDANNQDNYPLIHPYGSIRNLDTNLTYLTIQSAINAPETLNGHTIFVETGTYYENVNVNKSVSLVGEDRSLTIVDGNGTGNVVNIISNNVKIKGFTVKNSSHESPFLAGIYLSQSVKNCNISGNIVTDNSQGIYLDYYTSRNSFSDNLIATSEYYGISFTLSNNNTCLGNTLKDNHRGIHMADSSEIFFLDNLVTNNSHGISLWKSSNNFISGNIITYNEYEGIHLDYFSNNNILSMNTMTNGKEGIFIFRSSNNSLSKNMISNNSRHGAYLVSESANNVFFHNNFINNAIQALSHESVSIWDNGCEGNYWSNYNGTDLDGDGIGDTELPWESVDNFPLMNPYWLPGDVNHDLKIDIYDVVRITGVYGSEQGDPNWNCHSDIAEPYGIINIYDVVTCTKDYRKEYTP